MTTPSNGPPSDAEKTPEAPPKVDPEELALCARPRPVSRINRRVLALLCGIGLLLILGATYLALDPPRLFERAATGRELYQTQNVAKPDGLEALPRRYSDLAKPRIELGPPLPGDIGPAVVGKERELGLRPKSELPFRPDAEADALRAERIRLARRAQQARESGVFFQRTTRTSGATSQPAMNSGRSPLARGAQVEPNVSGRNPFQAAQAGEGRGALRFDLVNDQNLQARKLAFQRQADDKAIYNPHGPQEQASPYQVMAGTVISASLVTGIRSDLPGQIIAQVTENVYDTVSGRYLLIPQGARVIGTYDSVVAFGQRRAMVIWQRIVMPDGSSVVLENLPATDTAGYAGLEDEVNFHTWQLLKGIALSTLLGVGTELTFGDEEDDLLSAIREAAQDSANQAGQRLTARNLNIQPTITVRPGWPLRIIVNKDMVLRPYRG